MLWGGGKGTKRCERGWDGRGGEGDREMIEYGKGWEEEVEGGVGIVCDGKVWGGKRRRNGGGWEGK